ncbi:hypothetical protein [Streptomyces apocyni]|uniref:hypothetical protein n=1 Tax=Streptomyces apocyni TaxID=2654677 RepID=UPI0012EA462B|nr:hypothetical protein [Streptomyces apocyni]
MGNKKETLRWAPVAILLVLAIIAPLFGDSPTAVVTPLLLAIILASANGVQLKRERAAHDAG